MNQSSVSLINRFYLSEQTGPPLSQRTEPVRGSVEETLNMLLDEEADELCKARRYERKADRVDTRASTYSRKLKKMR